jgi:hypothetical protein
VRQRGNKTRGSETTNGGGGGARRYLETTRQGSEARQRGKDEAHMVTKLCNKAKRQHDMAMRRGSKAM